MGDSYVTLDLLKGTAALNITGTAYDSRLLAVAEAVSRQIDNFCGGRHFFYIIEDRHFSGDNGKELRVPDLISVSTLLEDTNMDGTFETGWAAADYDLSPFNAAPTSTWGRPYSALLVSQKSDATQDHFLKGQRNYRITGTWGWNKTTLDTGLNGSGTLTSTGTSLVLDGTVGTAISAGHTILLDNELMYVEQEAASTTTAVTIRRAMNGSTATAHSTSDVAVIIFPTPIVEAAFIQTARLWKRKDSAFAPAVGFPETGQMTVFGGLDPDVRDILRKSGYVRLNI